MMVAGFASLSMPLSDAQALETRAREAVMVDLETGTVLIDKDSDKEMPPASMSKLMTVYLVFERLKEGSISMDDTLLVSEKAWRKGGSKMFVEVGKRVTVEDLLRGVIVQSGNDACIVLAEGLAGSEGAFADDMNAKARELGMYGSHFSNSTGWPDPNHYTTARDLSILATRLIEDFPEYYELFSEHEFTYNKIKQSNRNPLLYKNIGADGLKTGHTQEAGYGLTGSAERNGRRLVLVVNGLDSARARSEESERLIDWGFREFGTYDLVSSGQSLDEVAVWLGDQSAVPITVAEDVKITLKRRARRNMKVSVIYDSPVPAPIKAGQEVATLRIEAPDFQTLQVPLLAARSVAKLGPFGRIGAAAKYLLFGQP